MEQSRLAQYLQAAVSLHRMQLLDPAETYYRQALLLQPDHLQAKENLVLLLGQKGNIPEALQLFPEVFLRHPQKLECLLNVLRLLMMRSLFKEVSKVLKDYIPFLLDQTASLNKLGIFLQMHNLDEEAIALYRKVLTHWPKHVDALSNMGLALVDRGEYEEALSCLNQAIELNPEHFNARSNRALLYLLLGMYQQGWDEYGAYRKADGYQKPKGLMGPLWEGEDLQGKTILLLCEQGAGDAIQFVRYAPLFQRRGARVLLACQPGLMTLFSQSPGVDVAIDATKPFPPHDTHFFLMMAPKLFGVDPAEDSSAFPYLFVQDHLHDKWRKQVQSISGRKIGVAWAGNPKHRKDLFRSLDPSLLDPLWAVEDCVFVSLQKSHPIPFPPMIDWTSLLSDFAETAALILQLDLVITVDTSIAHLAAALGKEVFILLPFVPDWRWRLHGSTTPWYPSVRLFRQKTRGDWSSVLEEVKLALEEMGAIRR